MFLSLIFCPIGKGGAFPGKVVEHDWRRSTRRHRRARFLNAHWCLIQATLSSCGAARYLKVPKRTGSDADRTFNHSGLTLMTWKKSRSQFNRKPVGSCSAGGVWRATRHKHCSTAGTGLDGVGPHQSQCAGESIGWNAPEHSPLCGFLISSLTVLWNHSKDMQKPTRWVNCVFMKGGYKLS